MIEACHFDQVFGNQPFIARVKAGSISIRDHATTERSAWCAERFGSIGWQWDRLWVERNPRTNQNRFDHDCYFLFTTYESAFEFAMRWGSHVQKPND